VVGASELFGTTITDGWRALVVVGAIAVIGLALLAGALLTKRRRAAERRQLEVPEFSAAEFHRFFEQQTWITQQLPPQAGPVTSPGMPPVGPGTSPGMPQVGPPTSPRVPLVGPPSDPAGRAYPQFVPPPSADPGDSTRR
jgi:hypothetical protein